MADTQDEPVELAVHNPVRSRDSDEAAGIQEEPDFWTLAERKDSSEHGHEDDSRHEISSEAPMPSSILAPSETHDWELLWDLGDVDKNGHLSKTEFDELFVSANGLSHKQRSMFDFVTPVPVVAQAKVDELWDMLLDEQDGGEQTVSKAAFLQA